MFEDILNILFLKLICKLKSKIMNDESLSIKQKVIIKNIFNVFNVCKKSLISYIYIQGMYSFSL